MLKIQNLNISYEANTAVKDINFDIQKGETVCIVGESGSGKTTIVKAIMQILSEKATINSGDILYQNEPLKCILPKDISIVFQDTKSTLNPVRKIGKQFIEYIRKHTELSKTESYELAVKMLKKLNLNENVMQLYPFELSGGMMQRVGLAMSFSLTPKILILDEPTSALDVTTQAKVIDEILKLKREFDVTILMITHNIPLAIFMADRVIVMKNGEIVEENTSENILKNQTHDYTKTLVENIPKFKVI